MPQKILHRDLKPGNIFLDLNSDVKLGDFGLARVLNNESQFAFTHVGTPYYMSPEQIHDQKYNEKSDIWSLGCIIYELCALHPPFQAQNPMALAMKIKEGKFERIRQSNDLGSLIFDALLELVNLHEIDKLIPVQGFQLVAGSQLQTKVVFAVSFHLKLAQQTKISTDTTDSGKATS